MPDAELPTILAATAAVTLRPMTEAELAAFRRSFAADWAVDLARLDDLAHADALAMTTARVDADLPHGLAPPGQHLYTIDAAGTAVGSLWFSAGQGAAFLEEVVIAPEHRGQGYGRAALLQLEARVAALGLTNVALHVYAHNPGAIALYERLGYVVTGLKMRKGLVVAAS